jgi:hypothetical protein
MHSERVSHQCSTLGAAAMKASISATVVCGLNHVERRDRAEDTVSSENSNRMTRVDLRNPVAWRHFLEPTICLQFVIDVREVQKPRGVVLHLGGDRWRLLA